MVGEELECSTESRFDLCVGRTLHTFLSGDDLIFVSERCNKDDGNSRTSRAVTWNMATSSEPRARPTLSTALRSSVVLPSKWNDCKISGGPQLPRALSDNVRRSTSFCACQSTHVTVPAQTTLKPTISTYIRHEIVTSSSQMAIL